MIELNEWDIKTCFNNGVISQHICILGSCYHIKPSKTIEQAALLRDELLEYVKSELEKKNHYVKINKYK